MSQRPSWDEYFYESTGKYFSALPVYARQVGALLVMDKHILTTGYNGAPSGLQHCLDIGCLREQLKSAFLGERHELCRGLHAEMNALLQASHYGIKFRSDLIQHYLFLFSVRQDARECWDQTYRYPYRLSRMPSPKRYFQWQILR